MKLTFYLAVNEDYIDFARVFIYSLKRNFPFDRVKKIIINDLGLNEEQRQSLEEYSLPIKLEYISTPKEKIKTDNIWGENWRNAINHKTEGLYTICEEENYPILMIDVDTYILRDFSDEILYGCDVQVCSQRQPDWTNYTPCGVALEYIGCWFVAHNDKAREFIYRWRHKMASVKDSFKETPALCGLMEQLSNLRLPAESGHNTHFTIKENHENNVCGLNAKIHTGASGAVYDPKVLHFRSNPSNMHEGLYKYSLEHRIKNVINMPPELISEILKI